MSIKSQAELLSLNRSGLYYHPLAPSAEEIALKHSIDELYTQHPYYGSRRITATLRRQVEPQSQGCAKTYARDGHCWDQPRTELEQTPQRS
jgi:hypothetical protein